MSAEGDKKQVDPDEEQWDVEDIRDRREIKGKLQYLVKWVGWSEGEEMLSLIVVINATLIHPNLTSPLSFNHRR